MKHILTSTAILLATATAINAQSTENQTLSQAISDSVTQYIDDQEHNGLSVDPEAVTSLATYAATEWNETQEGTAVAQNAILFNQLTASQSQVNNLTISLAQADEYLDTANANLKIAQDDLAAKQEEYDALEDEYHDTEAAYEYKIDNLEDDIADANENQKEAMELLGQALQDKAQLVIDLNTANTQLTAAQDHLEIATTQLNKAITDRQEALADLVTAQDQVTQLHIELTQKEAQYNALQSRVVVAGNKPYKVMGDVLQTSKDNGTYSGNSYDIGKITSNTAPTGLYVKDYTEIESVKIKGKYSEFNIATDLRLSKNSGNLAEFNSVIAEVKNAMYNEGYKDGYNDGFEDGYNVGYGDAVSDIKGN